MFEVFLLAAALAMDAFAVSICLGAKSQEYKRSYILRLAIYAALYFGISQGVMPLIGYLLGAVLLGWLAAAAPWIGGIILVVLGAKMLYDVFSEDKSSATTSESGFNTDEAEINTSQGAYHWTLFTLAIATSIDAMAAGFTLNLLAVNAWLACLIIGLITFVCGLLGVYLGWRSGTWLEEKAEVFGGLVLIAIGIKIMFFSQ